MEFSSKTICALFIKARSLVVTPERGGKNSAFKNEYSTQRDINNAIRYANSSVGITVLQEVIFNPENSSANIMLMQTTLLHIDESGEVHTAKNVMPVPIGKMDAQGFGSTFTYACRYALLGIYNLNGADDDGNGATIRIEKTVDMWRDDIRLSESIDGLNTVMQSAAAVKNKALMKALQPIANERKREINMRDAEGFNPGKPLNAVVNSSPSVVKQDSTDEEGEEF